MVTLGIDLAAEPRDTGGCAIRWAPGGATVEWVGVGLEDDEILRRARDADVLAIDAPFGWPTYFVEAIHAHHAGRPWPVESWDRESRRRLRLRATDEDVYASTGITPLSVSSDTIAIPATRCAWLLERLGVRDRSGDGGVYEAYPAAALFQWGLRYRGYKGRDNVAALAALFGEVRGRTPWLSMSSVDAGLCAGCDDAFDGLVASLIARAAKLCLTARPAGDEMPTARIEGWIALPDRGSLERLAAP